jgi:hypothetical protein
VIFLSGWGCKYRGNAIQHKHCCSRWRRGTGNVEAVSSSLIWQSF